MGKFMSNRNNLENIDEIIENYNKSMDHLKGEFKILNSKILNDYKNKNSQLQKTYQESVSSSNSNFSKELEKLESKNKIFNEIMPLTEQKYKKDVESLKSSNKLRIEKFNNEIEELDEIKATNDKRNEHLMDADNSNEVNQLKNKLDKIKEDADKNIKKLEEDYNNKINLLNKEYQSSKSKAISSNTEKKSILLKEYSDELMRIQNEYTRFKNEI